jgi:endonuclease G
MKSQIGLLITWLCQAGGLLLQYQNCKLEYNCQKRSADRFEYYLDSNRVVGAKRKSKFTLDPALAEDMQQLSVSSYMNVNPGFNRGHLVPSGHMCANNLQRCQANYMTNIVPQAVNFNGGIWQQTEQLTEKYRYDGGVYGN